MGEEVEKLKPCPFCGSAARLSRIISIEGDRRGERPSWDIDCTGTGCGVWRRFDAEADAVEAWNTRSALASSTPERRDAWRIAQVGKQITISRADPDVGNACVSPDQSNPGCYWTLIGGGSDEEQNALAQVIADALNATVKAEESAVYPAWQPTHRHLKRGTTYQVVGEGLIQTAVSRGAWDDLPVTIYRGQDGRWWARPAVEFNDGRFEPLAPAESSASLDGRPLGDTPWKRFRDEKPKHDGWGERNLLTWSVRVGTYDVANIDNSWDPGEEIEGHADDLWRWLDVNPERHLPAPAEARSEQAEGGR